MSRNRPSDIKERPLEPDEIMEAKATMNPETAKTTDDSMKSAAPETTEQTQKGTAKKEGATDNENGMKGVSEVMAQGLKPELIDMSVTDRLARQRAQTEMTQFANTLKATAQYSLSTKQQVMVMILGAPEYMVTEDFIRKSKSSYYRMIADDVPSMCKYVAVKTAGAEYPYVTRGKTDMNLDSYPEYIKKSMELTTEGTAVVMLVFSPRLYDRFADKNDEQVTSEQTVSTLDWRKGEIADINYFGSYMCQTQSYPDGTIVDLGDHELSKQVSEYLAFFIRLCNAFRFCIRDLKTVTISPLAGNNDPVFANLRSVPTKGIPTPAFSGVNHNLLWFRDNLNATLTAPGGAIDLTEQNAIQIGMMKFGSEFSLMTDQYTARANNLMWNSIFQNRITRQTNELMHRANSFMFDRIVTEDGRPDNHILIPGATPSAYTTMTLMTMNDPRAIIEARTTLEGMIARMKLFNCTSLEAFYSMMSSSGTTLPLRLLFPELSSELFIQLFVLEHFAPFHDITFYSEAQMLPEMYVFQLLNILLTIAFFPKLACMGGMSLLNILVSLISYIYRDDYAAVIAFGAVSRWNGVAYVVVENAIVYNSEEADQGYIYTIATGTLPRDRVSARIFALQQFLSEALPIRRLVRKEESPYVFMSNNYTTTVSYNEIMDQNRYQQRNSPLHTRITRALRIYSDSATFYLGAFTNSASRKNLESFYTSMLSLSMSIMDFARDMTFLSDTIMNSHFYVYDGFRPNSPFLKPQRFATGPLLLQDGRPPNAGALAPFPRMVVRINANVGFSVLAAAHGKTPRNLSFLIDNRPYAVDMSKIELGYNSFDTKFLTAKSLEHVKAAHNFLDAQLVIDRINQILTNVPANFQIAALIAQLMKNVSYAAIIKDVSDVFDTDASIFFRNAYNTGALADFRFSTLGIYLLNRETGEPVVEPDTLFGRGIITDAVRVEMESMTQMINMAAMLALSDNSPVINTATGLLLLRSLLPIQTGHLPLPGIIRRQIDWDPNSMVLYQDENIAEIRFTIQTIAGEDLIIRDPTSADLNNIVLVITDQNSVLPYQREFLVRAVVYGSLAIRLPNQNYRYAIDYVKDPSIMHTTQESMAKIVTSLLIQPRNSYPMLTFYDNTHTKIPYRWKIEPTLNYRVFHHLNIVPTYVIGAGIYGTTNNEPPLQPPQDYVPFSIQAMSYGARGLLNPLLPNGNPKIGAAFNTNNTVTVKFLYEMEKPIAVSVLSAPL